MKKIFICLAFLMLPLTAAFAETAIKSEVDKTSITTDDTLTLKIIVTSSEKQLPSLKVPEFKGFKVLSQAQSTSLSFAKQAIKTVLVHVFILLPESSGKFIIPAASIEVNKRSYATEPIQIEVVQGTAGPSVPQPDDPVQPEEELPDSGEPQYSL